MSRVKAFFNLKKYFTTNTLFMQKSNDDSTIKRNWFIELLKEALSNSTFESKLIEEYYLEITIPYIKKTLKTSMLLLIAYVYLTMFYASEFAPIETQTNISQVLILLALLLCLSLTLVTDKHKDYMRIAMFAVLIVIIQSMFTNYDMKSKMEIKYTPAIQMLVLVFTFIPLNLTAAVPISILTICFSLLSTMIRITTSRIVQPIPENQTILEGLRYDNLLPIGFNLSSYILGQIFLWVSAYLNSFYMFTCNHLWRRSAFVTLGENVQAKRKSKLATKSQLRWIEAIMPAVVKDEYWEHHLDTKTDKWVYIKTFDNVSILFADIVGFTKLSSNKSAPQVVTLLNDLFNRFDELCDITNCEKLGTLGDCYYCVAGCPIPRPDHAVSCIEMGLGMCRIIKMFNHYHNSDVNMRVGIHTGMVNAAILGKERFRFDVYSNDVLIANTMESSGLPGRVHISQSVYDLIRHVYNVEVGQGLEIKREEDHGIAGMLLKSTLIKTYYVDPKSSHFRQKGERFENITDFQVLDVSLGPRTTISSSFMSDDSHDNIDPINEMNAHKLNYLAKIDEGVAFIDTLRYDPDQQISCFQDPPINIITLSFFDPEIEWHFQSHTFDHIQRFSLYSAKLAPFVESMLSLISTILILCASIIFFYHDIDILSSRSEIGAMFGLTIALIIIEFWKASTYLSLLQRNYEKYFYRFLSNQLYRSMICVYMTMLPNIMCFVLVYDCRKYSNDYYFQARYFSLNLFALLNGSLYLSAWSWVKVVVLVFNFSQSILFGCFFTCNNKKMQQQIYPFYTCLGISKINFKYFQDVLFNEYLFQYIFTFITMIVLMRERERNLRIWFYVSREAEIGREEALRSMNSSQELLYNIIPKYVFDYIFLKGCEKFEIGKFNYALAIPKAGVVFACISNFFSKYYREDYKSGGNALKLLHHIITDFDNILQNKEYKDVEKIKTISDCYMLASGLNSASIESNKNKKSHLIALLDYAFDMQKSLAKFNEFYIIGTDKFQIKIGYNFGPVTAGIIGSTKPMYDIWGDTVNVSSRMYSTGRPGDIQVPHYVVDELKENFKFVYRDKIFVKGKGDMNTFLCLQQIKQL